MRSGDGNVSALIPGPTLLLAWASVYLANMLFAYLDEFGHMGPFVRRNAPKFNESPVFGLAGIILPGGAVRPFATRFLQLKSKLLKEDIEKAGKMPQKWEKKDTDIYRPKAVERYPEIRSAGFRLLNYVNACGGKVFYYGREKRVGETGGNSNGLYTTVMAHAIRRVDTFAHTKGEDFALVVDQHSARKELLECASKTMYGNPPAKRLVSPPFEVESYLNQNIQAADWIATIIGRLWAFRVAPDQYADHEQFERYFGERIGRLATHSRVDRRRGDEAPEAKARGKTVRYSVLDPLPTKRKAANAK